MISDRLKFPRTTGRDVSVYGNGGKVEDGFVFGGTTTAINGTINASFQGYGTILDSVHFSNMNRGVLGQAFSNSITVQNCTWNANTGSLAMEFNGAGTGAINGLGLLHNLIEMHTGYIYGIKLTNVQTANIFANSFYDATSPATSAIYLGAGSYHNITITGYNTVASLCNDDGSAECADASFYSSYQQPIIANSAYGSAAVQVPSLVSTTTWASGSLTIGYPGGITAAYPGNPALRFSMGVDSTQAYLDAYQIGCCVRTLNIQPAGGISNFEGHLQSLVTANYLTPTIAGCGSGATLSSSSTDTKGTITLGTTPGTCVRTFGQTYTTVPDVVVSFGGGVIGAYSVTATALTITATSLSGTIGYQVWK